MASRPDGDVWNIVDNNKDSQHYGRNFKFDFYMDGKQITDSVTIRQSNAIRAGGAAW